MKTRNTCRQSLELFVQNGQWMKTFDLLRTTNVFKMGSFHLFGLTNLKTKSTINCRTFSSLSTCVFRLFSSCSLHERCKFLVLPCCPRLWLYLTFCDNDESSSFPCRVYLFISFDLSFFLPSEDIVELLKIPVVLSWANFMNLKYYVSQKSMLFFRVNIYNCTISLMSSQVFKKIIYRLWNLKVFSFLYKRSKLSHQLGNKS